MSERPSKDPLNTDYIPSVFSDGRIQSNVRIQIDVNWEYRRTKGAVA